MTTETKFAHVKEADQHIDNLIAALQTFPFAGRDQEVRALDTIEGLRRFLRTIETHEPVNGVPWHLRHTVPDPANPPTDEAISAPAAPVAPPEAALSVTTQDDKNVAEADELAALKAQVARLTAAQAQKDRDAAGLEEFQNLLSGAREGTPITRGDGV